jgi:hypothetical protein
LKVDAATGIPRRAVAFVVPIAIIPAEQAIAKAASWR